MRTRIAAHELGGPAHGAVEIRFVPDLAPPALRFLVIDQAGIQIGVDRHLLVITSYSIHYTKLYDVPPITIMKAVG